MATLRIEKSVKNFLHHKIRRSIKETSQSLHNGFQPTPAHLVTIVLRCTAKVRNEIVIWLHWGTEITLCRA